MRVKKRYILVERMSKDMDAQIRSIKEAYRSMYGSDDLIRADIRGVKVRYRLDTKIIIRCNLVCYKNLMRVLNEMGVMTYLASGTLKSIKEQLLLMTEANIDGDDVLSRSSLSDTMKTSRQSDPSFKE
jgi:RNase P/RNase MRP subunit POP5